MVFFALDSAVKICLDAVQCSCQNFFSYGLEAFVYVFLAFRSAECTADVVIQADHAAEAASSDVTVQPFILDFAQAVFLETVLRLLYGSSGVDDLFEAVHLDQLVHTTLPVDQCMWGCFAKTGAQTLTLGVFPRSGITVSVYHPINIQRCCHGLWNCAAHRIEAGCPESFVLSFIPELIF